MTNRLWLGRDPVLTALESGKAKIRQGWCKGTYARDDRGTAIDLHSPYAVAFCMKGAIGLDPDAELQLMNAANLVEFASTSSLASVYENVAGFNDDPQTEHRHVLGLFDWAIALREKELSDDG